MWEVRSINQGRRGLHCSVTKLWKEGKCGRKNRKGSLIPQGLGLEGQVNKRIRWMPWRPQAMKDVAACEKLRGAGKQALIRRSLNGETHPQGYPHLNP
jgi:hypothetical protein